MKQRIGRSAREAIWLELEEAANQPPEIPACGLEVLNISMQGCQKGIMYRKKYKLMLMDRDGNRSRDRSRLTSRLVPRGRLLHRILRCYVARGPSIVWCPGERSPPALLQNQERRFWPGARHLGQLWIYSTNLLNPGRRRAELNSDSLSNKTSPEPASTFQLSTSPSTFHVIEKCNLHITRENPNFGRRCFEKNSNTAQCAASSN